MSTRRMDWQDAGRGPEGVVVRSRQARVGIHEHERMNSLRMGRGQQHGGQPTEVDTEYRCARPVPSTWYPM